MIRIEGGGGPNATTRQAQEDTVLSPRFYTTDFDELDRTDVTPVRAEWDELVAEMRSDPNKGHFHRSADWESQLQEMNPELRKEFIDFLGHAFGLMAGHSVDGSLHYICMDWRHMPELMAAGRKVYSDPRNLCVWVKSNAGMGSFYRSQHELIFIFKHGAAQHRNNVELGKHGRNRTNVWQYPGSSALNMSSDASLATTHPTVKPIQLVADAIKDCTARGDIVLDPFVGSGTSLLAAERTGRCGYGIELDPRYVDLTIKRWERVSKGSAVHAGSGMSFQQIALQRGGPQ